MNSKGWYSKQDVIKDIVEVTGKCLDDFGEHYVVGENPPQTWKTSEDDEDLSRFYGGQRQMKSDDIEKPDLVGITEMLRMVDNYYERPNHFSSSNEEHLKSKTRKSEPDNIIVSISKLNPNVNEFVPCNISQSSVLVSDIDSKLSKKQLKVSKDVSVFNVVGAEVTVKTDCCDTNVKTNVSDNRINISRLLSNELKEMREQLKTKICDTSKVKCVKLRRERNLAISSLIKLYCQPAAEENKPTLICPDYFKSKPANKNDVTEQNVEKIVGTNNTDDYLPEHILNASSEDEIIKKEIAASVDKVTRWLCNMESGEVSEQKDRVIKEQTPNITEIEIQVKKPIKGPSIHLGPMTFKRKTNNLPMSPVSLQSDNSKTKSKSFVPSVYASELTKKYIEQTKNKQDAQTDRWHSLETQLQKKEEAIKKKRLQTPR